MNQSKKSRFWFAALGLTLIFAFCADAGAQHIFKKKKKKNTAKTEDTAASVEPDKVLYNRALDDLKHGRYTEGRLALQTLINTYPDSEYLAKAKLAVADSFYKEGGTSNLTQSVQEYKDFITFFPFLDEAAYAQMQVGMAHYKMMEKADRDSAQAQQAEDEFQTMLLKYPQSPLAPQAEQRLRDVQEVLADGDYRVARFYYTKGDFRASAARLVEIADRYPLYSQSDDVLFLLGDVYVRMKNAVKDEDQKNHWADLAAKCYDRIIQEYPHSNHIKETKARLTSIGMPVPSPDPEALARVQKEEEYQRQHHPNSILKHPLGMVKSSPDVSVAAHSGQPNLSPPSETISASEVLLPNAKGPTFSMNGGAAENAGGEAGPTTQVDALTGGGTSSLSGAVPLGGTTAAAQIIEAPASAPAANATPQPNAAPANAPPEASAPAASPSNAPAPVPPDNAASAAAPPANTAPAATNSAPQGSSASAGSSDTQSGASPPASGDNSKESTSKKKKGVRKIIPW